jgi:hypothetical protein
VRAASAAISRFLLNAAGFMTVHYGALVGNHFLTVVALFGAPTVREGLEGSKWD